MANFKSKTFTVINNLKHDVSANGVKHQPNSSMPGREPTIIERDHSNHKRVYCVGHGRLDT